MQDDPRDFLPVRTFRLRVEKAQIGDVVLFKGVMSFPAGASSSTSGSSSTGCRMSAPRIREGLSAVRPRKRCSLTLVIGELVTA